MAVDAGTETRLDEEALAAFAAGLRGPLLRPGDEGYDDARTIWNGLIDRRPALIVQASGAADVVDAVNFAREQRLTLSVKGGGHNVAGNAVNDGGLVIDLSRMNGVHVDGATGKVRVQGGATWGDCDRETQLFGLAVPGGVVSTTGIGGLTLHGGIGHLRRKHGLSIDNLLSVDIVTADGQLRRASATENADLFWAVRGAGSNFGVVTSFEFQAHPVGPLVTVAAVMYPADAWKTVVPGWRDFMEQAPDELSSLLLFWSVPAHEPFPPELHGQPIVLVAAVWSGDPAEGEQVVQPLRELAQPLLDMSGPWPWLGLQSGFDALFPKGGLYYWKSRALAELTDEALDDIADVRRQAPVAADGRRDLAPRRSDEPRRRGRHRVRRQGRDLPRHGRGHVDGSGAERRRARVGPRALGRPRPPLDGRCLPQLPGPRRGAGRPRPRRLRRQLRAPGGAEAEVRPGQPLPDEPEHRARGVAAGMEPGVAAARSRGDTRVGCPATVIRVERCGTPTGRQATPPSGSMFWLSRKMFVGSYSLLSTASRAYFSAP